MGQFDILDFVDKMSSIDLRICYILLFTLTVFGGAVKSSQITRCQKFIKAFDDLDSETKDDFLDDDELTDKYEHCKEILDSYESDNDNEDSEFGIVNEEDNLIHGFELCQTQLFSQSHHRGAPVNFEVGKWKKHNIK